MAGRPWQIEGDGVIFDWLTHEHNLRRREIFLDWLAEFAMDPEACSQSVPEVYLGYVAIVRMQPPPDVAVSFVLVEQFRTIVISKIRRVP